MSLLPHADFMHGEQCGCDVQLCGFQEANRCPRGKCKKKTESLTDCHVVQCLFVLDYLVVGQKKV